MQKLPSQLANHIILGKDNPVDKDLLLIEIVGLIKTRGYCDDKISATSVLKALVANVSKTTLLWLLEKLFVLFLNDRSGLGYICDKMFAYGIYGRGGISGAPAEIKSEKEREGKCFPYIPYEPRAFLEIINRLAHSYDRKKLDFIDVGSGIGDKVLLAQLLGFKTATGVEINEHTSQLAKHFLNVREENNITLINKDAFDLDFSNYNFIYMYRPIQCEKLLAKLHKKVLDEMPVGGTFIDVGACMQKVLEIYTGKDIDNETTSRLYIVKNDSDAPLKLRSYSTKY